MLDPESGLRTSYSQANELIDTRSMRELLLCRNLHVSLRGNGDEGLVLLSLPLSFESIEF